jgi:hypothetical protein
MVGNAEFNVIVPDKPAWNVTTAPGAALAAVIAARREPEPAAALSLVFVTRYGRRTVKLVALVADPAGVLTVIGPVVAAGGTIATICVSVIDTGVTAAPLKSSAPPVKCAPDTVTCVPTTPLVGVKPEIVGGVPASNGSSLSMSGDPMPVT